MFQLETKVTGVEIDRASDVRCLISDAVKIQVEPWTHMLGCGDSTSRLFLFSGHECVLHRLRIDNMEHRRSDVGLLPRIRPPTHCVDLALPAVMPS